MANEKDVHKNYNVLLAQGITNSTAKALTSVALVLPFLYASAGAPIIIAGMLVPVATVAKRAVQILAAPFMRTAPSHKGVMSLTAIALAAVITIINLTLYAVGVMWLVPIFLFASLIIGASNGVNSLVFQDLIGRIFTHKTRSRLLLTQSCLAGVNVIVLTVGAQLTLQPGTSFAAHQELIWLGACLFVMSALLSMAISEPPSHYPRNGSNGSDHLSVLSEESKQYYLKVLALPWFRKFLIARTLYLSVELAIPFFSIHAASYHGNSISGLNTFVIAVNVGLVAGYFFWSKIGKITTNHVMIIAAGITGIGGLLALAIELGFASQTIFLYAIIFVLVSIGTQGIKIGRTLYLINNTTDDERPYCIVIANGIIGILGIILGALLGALASFKGVAWPIFVLFVLNIMAAAYTSKLRIPK